MRRNAALISYSHVSWSNTGNCVIKMCSQKFHLRMLFITCLNTFEHVWTHAHVIVCLSWKGLVMLVENVTNGSTWCRTFRTSIDILIDSPPAPSCKSLLPQSDQPTFLVLKCQNSKFTSSTVAFYQKSVLIF